MTNEESNSQTGLTVFKNKYFYNHIDQHNESETAWEKKYMTLEILKCNTLTFPKLKVQSANIEKPEDSVLQWF